MKFFNENANKKKKKIVLVGIGGAGNNAINRVICKEQKFISHHPEGWEVQDQVSGRYMATSCCVLTWWMEPGSPLRPLS